MPDINANGDAGESNLAWQALLYASGELDEGRSAAFEERLGNDQAAREALRLAAQLAVVPGTSPGLRPNPDYRDVVRLRLNKSKSGWQGLWGRRAYRGHPMLWGLVGAAAAVLMMVGLGRSGMLFSCDSAPAATVVQAPAPQLDEDPAAMVPSLEAANVWAEISQSDHLLKARGDELRRKTRSEEWHRLVNSDARRTRVPPNPCYDGMR
jgi:hypothetical protein